MAKAVTRGPETENAVIDPYPRQSLAQVTTDPQIPWYEVYTTLTLSYAEIWKKTQRGDPATPSKEGTQETPAKQWTILQYRSPATEANAIEVYGEIMTIHGRATTRTGWAEREKILSRGMSSRGKERLRREGLLHRRSTISPLPSALPTLSPLPSALLPTNSPSTSSFAESVEFIKKTISFLSRRHFLSLSQNTFLPSPPLDDSELSFIALLLASCCEVLNYEYEVLNKFRSLRRLKLIRIGEVVEEVNHGRTLFVAVKEARNLRPSSGCFQLKVYTHLIILWKTGCDLLSMGLGVLL
ncbi:PREDICTED: uncharacterized protein LOC101313187 [Fragaria vesca subsp. vesca]